MYLYAILPPKTPAPILENLVNQHLPSSLYRMFVSFYVLEFLTDYAINYLYIECLFILNFSFV